MLKLKAKFPKVNGLVRLTHAQTIDPSNWDWSGRLWVPNMVTRDATGPLVRLLANQLDGKVYHIRAVYLEFENNPGGDVDVPDDEDIDRTEGYDYYHNLSGTRDYLRVPVLASAVSSSSEDYPNGNIMTFFAQTAGTTGVNGTDYGADEDSVIYGAALVVSPDYDDEAQDIVFARTYFDGPNQLPAVDGSQISLAWQQTYE